MTAGAAGLATGDEMLFFLRKLSAANWLSLALLLLWIAFTNWLPIIFEYRGPGLVLPAADSISEHIVPVLVCGGVPLGAIGAAISAAQLRTIRDIKRELTVPSSQTWSCGGGSRMGRWSMGIKTRSVGEGGTAPPVPR